MASLVESLLSVETLMNVMVFVFIGLMVWLYFKESSEDDSEEKPD